MAVTQGQWDREIDIRGQVCPYTYVRTKLALEEMGSGQVLRVIVDHEPAVTNVPRSASMDGHTVRSTREIQPGHWEILLVKGRDG